MYSQKEWRSREPYVGNTDIIPYRYTLLVPVAWRDPFKYGLLRSFTSITYKNYSIVNSVYNLFLCSASPITIFSVPRVFGMRILILVNIKKVIIPDSERIIFFIHQTDKKRFSFPSDVRYLFVNFILNLFTNPYAL